jgi:transposase-like protein
MTPEIDERTIELICDRVAAKLRDKLDAIAADLLATSSTRPLTVEQVAERFGVARSTVYARWREWGGYKLGEGPNTAIRFPAHTLPEAPRIAQREAQPAKRRRRAGVLRGAPRLPSAFDEPSRETA